MTREQKYREQLTEFGIYQELFEPEIHTLAELERDLQRLNKRWKADGCPTVDTSGRGPVTSDKTLDAIMALRKEILAHRDALGLTPKGLKRLKREQFEASSPEEGSAVDTSGEAANVLEFVRQKYGA